MEANPVLHASKKSSRKSNTKSLVQKPSGSINSRVEAVGPKRFGIVAVDCGKLRSRWMLADFFGNILSEPSTVEHNKNALRDAVQRTQHCARKHQLADVIVVVERTGNYHKIPKRAWSDAGFEVRIIDPLATARYRQTVHPGTKTDDIDLGAIVRAAAAGFGLFVVQAPPAFERLQLVVRQRRDLVDKNAVLRCQIKERLHTLWPGYAKCFDDVCDSQIGLFLPRHFLTADEVARAGSPGLTKLLRDHNIAFRKPTLESILLWTASSSPGAEHPDLVRGALLGLERDSCGKLEQIDALELEMARLLVQTEYVVLMSICGINIVTAADLAAEAGPISSYACSRALTGRAGLYPMRYQSDQVDRKNGRLVRCGNRRLRQALMRIAKTLITCNRYYGAMAKRWESLGYSAKDVHVRIASRFSRTAYAMIAGGQAYRHPSGGTRDYVMQKLMKFYVQHNLTTHETLCDLQKAALHLPEALRAQEAATLSRDLDAARNKRGDGPRRLCEILPAVLAKLGLAYVESDVSGETTSTT